MARWVWGSSSWEGIAPQNRYRIWRAVMTDRSGQYEPVLAASRSERVCQWALRFILPVLLALCGLLIFWIWFDNVYGRDSWSFVGGLLVALPAVPLSLWTLGIWSRTKA